jgi:hypothetical protein
MSCSCPDKTSLKLKLIRLVEKSSFVLMMFAVVNKASCFNPSVLASKPFTPKPLVIAKTPGL